MARFLTVGAAQMGPVGRNESRSAVVVRLLELMREAKSRHCDLVVFTECALTPFFPRWWEDDPAACDAWFERDLPGPGTHLLFNEAQKLGIAFHLGFAELAEEDGGLRRYNTSILVGPDGKVIGKYRKIHLPGLTQREGENPHRSYEKHYFEVGNLGFGAWKALGGVVGMCLGNDRRWPESYRMLALQGAEIVLVGYNTAADHPGHPELDHLTNFHSMLSMQAGAYQNGCFVVGVAKAGLEEGFHQIGRSVILAPSGEVVVQCTSLRDELIVHRCDLNQTRLYKDHIFNFAAHREIAAYSLLTETRGPIAPREPGEFPIIAGPAVSAAPETSVALPVDDTAAIEKLFKEEYGYSAETAQDLAERAKLARDLPKEKPAGETAPEKPAKSVPSKLPQQKIASKPSPPKAPADPLEGVREVLQETYHYSAEAIEPIVEQARRALELQKSPETEPQAPKPVLPTPKKASTAAEILAKARSKSKPAAEGQPAPPIAPPLTGGAADDIGWLPGRFPERTGELPDRTAAIVGRLTADYRYPEPAARKVAEWAEAAWQKMHEAEEPAPARSAEMFVPEKQAKAESDGRQPLTAHIAPRPLPDTAPSLSGEAAFAVYSLLTDTYGYAPKSARSIAEQANTAWERWQTPPAEAEDAKPAAKVSPKSAKPVSAKTKVPATSATAVAEEKADRDLASVPCPECGFLLKVDRTDPTMRGRKARCPQCQTKFRLPESI